MLRRRKDEKGKSPVNFMQDKDYQKEDWQKKSGKNDEGGLNEKGRKSLRKRKIQEAILKDLQRKLQPS